MLAGCGPDSDLSDLAGPPEPEPVVCSEPFERKVATRQVVGFYPGWKHGVLPPSEIRWDKLTRVIYAFALPRPDGSLEGASDPRKDGIALGY